MYVIPQVPYTLLEPAPAPGPTLTSILDLIHSQRSPLPIGELLALVQRLAKVSLDQTTEASPLDLCTLFHALIVISTV